MKRTYRCLLCWLAALLLAFTTHAPAVADSRTAVSCGLHYTVLEDGTVSISQYQGDAEPLVIPATLDGRTVTVIGRETLDAFSHVVSVSIPDTVTAIDSKAFYGCASLRSVVIPDTVAEIGPFAFLDCASLTSFTLPDSVTELGATPLSRCSRLRSIDVSPGHPTFASMNGVLFRKADKALIAYPCGKSGDAYSIPEGVALIGDDAFSGCRLTTVVIPGSVTEIGDGAFCLTEQLATVDIPASITSIDDSAFGQCPSLTLCIADNAMAAQYARGNGIPCTTGAVPGWLAD